MPKKEYETGGNALEILAEPAVAYRTKPLRGNVETASGAVLPGQVTIAELKTELRQSLEDSRNGLGITLEQARARRPRLL